MLLLTEDAKIVCDHELGNVKLAPIQRLVTIEGRSVLVNNDPEGRPIVGCPNIGATIKPCTATLDVEAGYSELVRIDNKAACLDAVTGLTDGTPPGTIKYKVRSPGQSLVSEA